MNPWRMLREGEVLPVRRATVIHSLRFRLLF
jgi:hypothetical protein